MLKTRWTKLLAAALCLGVTAGSASIAFAQEQLQVIGGDFPNQCYFDSCRGCGNTCGGTTSICCKQ
jgi:hypothetical protein